MILYLLSIIPKFLFSSCKKEYFYLDTNYKYLNRLLVFLYLHINTQAKMFVDLSVVDIIKNKDRFVIIYQLLSYLFHSRYFIKISVNEFDKIYSISSLFPNASWYEREAWDLFGTYFVGNKDMRRILTDYGFQGHPLRKDFPLSGFIELSYSERIKNIKYSSVSFIQEFRLFDTKSPWNFFSN
ncbi:MAG: nad9, PhpafMp29 [Haloplasmataceae bacterium]|jgi:NADH-quinone oxidoreductase subunit C|nr:nad9, PhpafMp29 [Haloplasmataceae bacterium]